MKILLVDDDAELCQLVSQYFQGRGFEAESEGEGLEVDEWMSAGTLAFKPAAHVVRCGGEMAATEFDLLHFLMLRAGRLVNRDDLSQEALGRRLLPLDRSFDFLMSKLRRKLGSRADAPNLSERCAKIAQRWRGVTGDAFAVRA